MTTEVTRQASRQRHPMASTACDASVRDNTVSGTGP
jgi:hypothetical protein